ncbi:MAG: DsbA family protein [Hyphomicrobiales bacterium]|nr:DsbA family protein [Hyphomicrobiales bacterium]
MKTAILTAICGVAVSAVMLGAGFLAGSSARTDQMPRVVQVADNAPLSSAADKAAIEAIIHDYLVKNPEVMLEVQDALEKKQGEAQRLAQGKVIQDSSKQIFDASYDGIVGNPEGKISIVEFFDYNCHFCKGAMTDMQALVKENKDLRFVLKEFPILGEDSAKASIVSMAFKKLMPQKYGDFHQELLGGKGRADEAKAIKIALSLGADEAALRNEMKDPAIQQDIQSTYDLANKLSISGTPSYVIGDEVVFGALGKKVLDEKLANVRACDHTAC